MKKILGGIIGGIIFLNISAFADPLLTSWQTNYSGQYARVYTTTNKENSGTSSITWTNQSLPAYADIANIYSSATWVYIRYPDLASYTMGPWLTPNGGVFQFWPVNQHDIAKFPRSPAVQNGTKTISGTGFSGNYVNGMAIFNFTDGKAWDGGSIVSGPHNRSTYYWHRNAPVGEGFNFDEGLGHQNPSGVYHTHQNPIALRYQLGDHVTYNSSSKTYSESTDAVTQHSPIVGWAYDGYPIYGPYGYSISNNANSGVRRMVSGYVERDGSYGTDNIATNLGVIPAWYARFREAHFAPFTYSTVAGTNRAPVNSTYPIGTFAEDFAYLGDLTNSSTGKSYVEGTDFDLDVYNGRWCVTPEYPNGTYAYFIDIDTNGDAVYPYVIAYEYYGVANGSNNISSITESVTTNFMGGPDTTLTLSTPAVNATNYTVTLVWSSAEGGTYQVDNSTNQSNWVTKQSGVASQGISTTTNFVNITSNGTSYARVSRTALAGYDDTGGGTGVTNQTATTSYLIGNDTPTVANPISNQTNNYGNSFSFTFSSNTFTDIDSGQTLTYSANSAALTNTGISFNSSTRTFSATEIDSTNGTITGSYTVQVVATDNGSPAMSATNSFTLVINKATASVSVNAATRTYGGTNPAFTGTLTGFLSPDAINANYSTTATTNSSAGIYLINATLTDPHNVAGNYTITTNTGTLTISKAPVTVTANNISRTYGGTNPVFVVTYTGFTNGQALATSGITGAPTLTTSATTNSAVGSYTITNSVGSLSSANYSFTTANGTLTINKASLFASADSFINTYGQAMPIFTGTISGATNGDTFTESFSCPATTNSTPGSYSIAVTVNDPGSKLSNYALTTFNGQFLIVPATLLVVPENVSRAYGSTNPVFTSTFTGFVNGQTLATSDVTGVPFYTTAATTNSVVGIYFVTNYIGTLTSSNYMFTFTNSTLTVTQTSLTVTPANVSRAYGQANPVLTGTLAGIVNGDDISASYSTTATTNSAIGSYPITATLNDPASKLTNYSVITNQGVLTVTNASGSAGGYATIYLSNSVVTLAAIGTTNFTFFDTNSGLSVVVAVTMSPYSASNVSPSFTFLDTYGPGGKAVHLGVESGTGGGDGNWVDYFEGVNFAASLVSVSAGIDTNSIQFGVVQFGIRPNGGNVIWTSPSITNSFAISAEQLYPLDVAMSALGQSSYSGKLRGIINDSSYQISDLVNSDYFGIVFKAVFYEGTLPSGVPTIAAPTFVNNRLQFSIDGSSGASYIVQATTNLTSGAWTSISTNAAPFTFIDTNTAAFDQRFYRVISQQ